MAHGPALRGRECPPSAGRRGATSYRSTQNVFELQELPVLSVAGKGLVVAGASHRIPFTEGELS